MERRRAGRPHQCRFVAEMPEVTVFKPAGVPARLLALITLTVDEFEAVRLADHQGLYHEQAAEAMGVSRQTFSRIVAGARGKIAQALVEGRALRIEGGNVTLADADHRPEHGCRHCGGPHTPETACNGRGFRRRARADGTTAGHDTTDENAENA